MSYVPPAASGGGANYWDTVPIGDFTVYKSNQAGAFADAVNPLIDVVGAGVLESVGSASSASGAYSWKMEIDGVMMPVRNCMNYSSHTTEVEQLRGPIKFNTSFKLWYLTGTANLLFIVRGRLV